MPNENFTVVGRIDFILFQASKQLMRNINNNKNTTETRKKMRKTTHNVAFPCELFGTHSVYSASASATLGAGRSGYCFIAISSSLSVLSRFIRATWSFRSCIDSPHMRVL